MSSKMSSEKLQRRFKAVINDDLRAALEKQIQEIADQLVEEKILEKKSDRLNNNNNHRDESKTHDNDRKFMARNSLLTDLLEISHIRTIYHIFIVILILLFLNTMLYDLIDNGSINIGLGLIIIGFGKIYQVAFIWSAMFGASLLPYYSINLWRACRLEIHKKLPNSYLDSILGLLCYIVFQLFLLTLPIGAVIKYNLPIASAIIILTEMVRMMMKTHAYVRSMIPRVLQNAAIPLPPLSWYLYFSFAPTLVYRDSYPRTKKMEWGKVISRLLEVIAVVFYLNFLCERFLIHSWSNFGSPDTILEARQMVLTLFGSMLPALLMFLCGFYLLLHAWHNATAEIMTFADRGFYSDWWNQSDYGGFYRTWNMIVHNWLYEYVYKDIILISGRKSLATFFVFFISATFHEIILTFAFGFFYPVMLVMFGVIGLLLIIATKKLNRQIGNVLLWLSLAIGNGLLWSMYGAEYFSRVNCPPTVSNKILDLMIPRSWFCHRIVFTSNWKLQNPFERV